MADDTHTGENPNNSELQKLVSEEVAKAIGANLPAYMENMQQTMREFIHQEFTSLKAIEGPKRVTYKEFVACHPTEFKGEVDPLKARRWISDMEGAFETSHFDPSDRVLFAGNQLRERGKDWWELLTQEMGLEGVRALEWEEYKVKFLKRFCLQTAINRIHEEFLQLREKDEDIDTITAIFFDKAKFCPDLLRTGRMWINHYYRILNFRYREFLYKKTFEKFLDLLRRQCTSKSF